MTHDASRSASARQRGSASARRRARIGALLAVFGVLTGVAGPKPVAVCCPSRFALSGSALGAAFRHAPGGMLMPTHRETHYSLLFLFLGVIAALGGLVAKTGLTAESIWFLVIGAIGFLISRVSSNAGLTQLFDIVVGALLGLAGLAGILLQFKRLPTPTLPSRLA